MARDANRLPRPCRGADFRHARETAAVHPNSTFGLRRSTHNQNELPLSVIPIVAACSQSTCRKTFIAPDLRAVLVSSGSEARLEVRTY